MQHTIHSTLTQDALRLTTALALDSSGARIEVQSLLQHVLKTSRAWLLAHPEHCLNNSAQAHYAALLQRRLCGEPIAYMLGEREFFGLMFKVTPDVLIPRPETELLVELALERCGRVAAPPPGTHRPPSCGGIPSPSATLLPLPGKLPLLNPLPQAGEEANEKGNSLILAGEGQGRGCAFRVLDLGTGSGAIALAIAHARPDSQVLACDASSAALEVARENAQLLGIANTTFVQSDWFSALDAQRFDMIVSNPPYIAADDPHLQCGDVCFEPPSALASGDDGLHDIRHIISQAKIHLDRGGWLLLEHGYDQAAQARELLQQNGFDEIFTACDLAGIERVSGGRA